MENMIYYRIKDKITCTSKRWDQLAPNISSIKDFAQTYLNPEPLPNSPDGYSLEYALSVNGENYNYHLRTDFIDNNDRRMSNMVFQHTCKADIVIYRGVTDTIYNDMLDNARDLNDVNYYDKGYSYGTLIKGTEFNCRHRFRILVPAGLSVIYLGNIGGYQYEAVIHHGAKLRLVSKDRDYYNCQVIDTDPSL